MAKPGYGNNGAVAFSPDGTLLAVDNEGLVKKYFHALADGGTVIQPLNPTFFASSFGMVTDKFGVTWMVLAAAPVPA